MNSRYYPRTQILGLALLAFFAISGQPGLAQAMTQAAPAQTAGPPPIDGVISSIRGSMIAVTTASGDNLNVAIGENTLILGRRPATLDSIRPGEAMGVAATRGNDGSLTATAINVFSPELWQRVRKGQFPMPSGQVMTNAELDRVADHVQGRTLYLKFEMLTAAIDVPASADIRRTVTLKLPDLAAGMKVSIRGTTAGAGNVDAAMVSVDLPGN